MVKEIQEVISEQHQVSSHRCLGVDNGDILEARAVKKVEQKNAK